MVINNNQLYKRSKVEMQVIKRMNNKMEEGWKLTDVNCEQCKGVTMGLHRSKELVLYCPKCDKQVQNTKQSKDGQSDQQEDYYENIIQNSKCQPIQKQPYSYEDFDQLIYKQAAKTNDISKKMGEKLAKGWAMLNQSCKNCNVPLMKSKKGQKICDGCGTDYSKQKPLQKIQEQQKQSPVPKEEKQKSKQKKVPTMSLLNSKSQKKQQISRQTSHNSLLCQKIDSVLQNFIEASQKRLIEQIQKGRIQGAEKIVKILLNIRGKI